MIVLPNKRLQLAGAERPGLRPVLSAGGGQRNVEFGTRACRPQLNRKVVSNCLGNQVLAGMRSGCQGAPSRAIALRIVRSFRMQAVRASLAGLPAARKRR